jgi:hypothetical protein
MGKVDSSMTIKPMSSKPFSNVLPNATSGHAAKSGQGTLTPIGFGLRMSPGAEIGSNARWQQGGAELNLFYFFATREDGGSSEGEADR